MHTSGGGRPSHLGPENLSKGQETRPGAGLSPSPDHDTRAALVVKLCLISSQGRRLLSHQGP